MSNCNILLALFHRCFAVIFSASVFCEGTHEVLHDFLALYSTNEVSDYMVRQINLF